MNITYLRVHFDIEKFNAFAEGYLEGSGGILNSVEMKYLPLSGALLSFIMGVRFLSDYLNNDPYYKTKYSEQNYTRANCQFELARQILSRQFNLELF